MMFSACRTAVPAMPSDRREAVLQILRAVGGEETSHVRYVFSGPARTDGRTVWLGDASPEDSDFMEMTLGHGIHELMHVLFTDLRLLRGRTAPLLAQRLFNVLEDVRIDRTAIDRHKPYKGCRERLTERLENRGMLLAASTRPMARDLAPAAWLHAALAAEILDFAWARRFEPRLRLKVQRTFGAAACRRMLELARTRVLLCRDSGEVLDLALEVNEACRRTKEARRTEDRLFS